MHAHDTAIRPTLSILIAVGDTAPHLTETIGSVVAQTAGDWELVIVHTGRAREVEQITAAYADDTRIRLVRRQYSDTAGGVNAAAEAARGAYFAVVLPGGRLKPAFCERVAEVLAEHPEIDVLCVDALPFDEGEDQWPSFRQRCGVTDEAGYRHAVGLAEIVRQPALYSTAAIRASVWHAVGGYPADTPQVESLAMCLRVSAAGYDIRVLPEQLAGYRLGPDGPDDGRGDDEYDIGVERAFLAVATLTDDPEVLAELRSTLRKHRYEKALRLARQAMRDSDPRTAREQARLALRQRFSARPAAMWVLLSVAPGAVGQVRTMKRRLTGVVRAGLRRR